MKAEAPEPLANILSCYLDVNVLTTDWAQDLTSMLRQMPERNALFRQQLAEAILHDTINPAQYEELTGHRFYTQEQLRDWLRARWTDIYGDEPVSPGSQ